MPQDLLDQVAAQQQQPSGGDLLDQVHARTYGQQPAGGFLQEAVVNPARQVASGATSAVATSNRLTANLFDLLDKGADAISQATGTNKGGAFRVIADWARRNQASEESKAAELAGGRQDFTSQLYRGATQGAMELPQYAIAGHALGPVAGVAAVSGLQESDKGWQEALKAAATGAATGGALTVMGPASRPIRLTGAAAMSYAQARLNGADHATALANATTMGLMSAQQPGGMTAREIGRNAVTAAGGVLQEAGSRVIPPVVAKAAQTIAPQSTLNSVQQQAVDFMRNRDVPMRVGTQTGNRAIQALEATTAKSPLGAQTAAQFDQSTVNAMQRVGGELADETHGQPGSPESVGRAIPKKMDQIIDAESIKRDAAYKRAWAGRDNPTFDETVPVRMTRGDEVLDSEGKGTGIYEQKPVMAKVNMPVDVRDIKDLAQPIYDQMSWRLAPAEQNSSPGYNAIDKLLKGPDYIPAWQAEDALGGLKSMSRLETGQGVRDVSQGIAAHLIPELQKGIDAAVAKTGNDAIQGLQEGRRLHAGIMDVEEVARQLRDKEPVKAFGRLVTPHDANVDFVREVAKLAPEQMPAVGRAFAEDLIRRVTREGDIAKTQGALNDWRDLGDETKKIYFPDPQLRSAWNNFFKGLDMVVPKVNPSGTELTRQATSLNPLRWLQGYVGSKLFYTPEGIKLMTDAMNAKTPGAAALARAKANAAEQAGANKAKLTGSPPNPNPPAAPTGTAPAELPSGGDEPNPTGGEAAQSDARRRQGKTEPSFEAAEVRFRPGANKAPGTLYGNLAATEAISHLAEGAGLEGYDSFVGMSMPRAHVEQLLARARWELYNGGWESAQRRDLRSFIYAAKDALDRPDRSFVYVEKQNFGDMRRTLREERFHEEQRRYAGLNGEDHVDTDALFQHPAAGTARTHLLDMAYEDHPDGLAAEIGAKIAAGDWKSLGLDEAQARSLFQRYSELLVSRHGPGVVFKFRAISPILKEAFHEPGKHTPIAGRGLAYTTTTGSEGPLAAQGFVRSPSTAGQIGESTGPINQRGAPGGGGVQHGMGPDLPRGEAGSER